MDDELSSVSLSESMRGPSGGSSGGDGETGWVLVGLLLGISVVYFGGGYVYNWKVKGAEASERLPHKDFWVGLPGLVKVRWYFDDQIHTDCTGNYKHVFTRVGFHQWSGE